MKDIGCDRRILRAFYTQYVAVLLILLTFSIAAFQRATQTAPKAQGVVLGVSTEEEIGTLSIHNLFLASGEISSDNTQLKAVAAVLQNHDVNAEISLSTSREQLESDPAVLSQLLTRAHLIEDFLIREAVSTQTFKIAIKTDATRTEVVAGAELIITFSKDNEAPHEPV